MCPGIYGFLCYQMFTENPPGTSVQQSVVGKSLSSTAAWARIEGVTIGVHKCGEVRVRSQITASDGPIPIVKIYLFLFGGKR